MNVKTWIPLALAIVLGLIAAKVARDTLARNRSVGQTPTKTVTVVVTKTAVPPGQELTAELLAMGPISAAAPPAGAFTDPAAVVGRVSAVGMFPGQPVMDSLLAAKGSGSGLQALVPKGMRAITVEVNETSGVAGMIIPGCRVDVVCTLARARRADTVACTVVQDVLVQAVGQRLTATRNPDEKEPAPVRTITLIASPREAEAIELASSTGRTRLVLRGTDDRGVNDSTGVSFVELLRDDRTTAPPRVAPVDPVGPVTPVATTRPVSPQTQPVASDPFGGDAPRNRRTVTLIRGGARSEFVFDVPADAKAPAPETVSSTNGGAVEGDEEQ
jgi:pilus assembly protein CpaB